MNILPDDFDWQVYCVFNEDLWNRGIRNKKKAIEHWNKYGIKESRLISLSDFDYKIYLEENPHITLENRLEGLRHYFLNSKIEKTFENKTSENSKKKLYIMLSHDVGGGLSKYVVDFLINVKINDYDIITNETRSIENVKYVDNIIDYIYNSTKYYDDVILHFNILPNYLKYDNKTIKIFFDKVYSLNIKVIITIHDFFLFYPTNPNPTIEYFLENDIDKKQIENIENIFKRASAVIFPTEKVKFHFMQKNIRLNNVKNKVLEHIDIDYKSKEYYNTVLNKIHIICLASYNEHKGKKIIDAIIKNNDKNIILHLIGNFPQKLESENVKVYGVYEYDDIFKIINKIKPHLGLLISNYYETYSYVTSVYLKLGIPLFYNNDVYQERLKNRTNIYPYNNNDVMNLVIKKLHKCVDDLKEKQNDEYTTVDEEIKMHIPSFYNNFINNVNAIRRNKYDSLYKYNIFIKNNSIL